MIGTGTKINIKTKPRKMRKTKEEEKTLEELEKMYKEGKYKEIVNSIDLKYGDINGLVGAGIGENTNEFAEIRYLYGCTKYQLGLYSKAEETFQSLKLGIYLSPEMKDKTVNMLGHSLAQQGKMQEAIEIIRRLPASLKRDNLELNVCIEAARKGLLIPLENVVEIAKKGMVIPHETINGHILNNAALAIYESTKGDRVEGHTTIGDNYLNLAIGYITMAIRIYEMNKAQKNHIAGAKHRMSLIAELIGWPETARVSAERSVTLWQELVNEQGGERYQKNLENAEKQLAKFQNAPNQ